VEKEKREKTGDHKNKNMSGTGKPEGDKERKEEARMEKATPIWER
jgi:hypothetical protein